METKKFFIGIGILAGVVFCTYLMLSMNVNDAVMVEHRVFKPVLLDMVGGDASLPAGESGILEFVVVNHSTSAFTVNITGAGYTIYANATVNDTHAGSNVPYSTAFDLVWKVRFNVTHAWNGTGFDSTYTRGYLNCTGLSVSGVQLTQQFIANDSTYIYYNFYIQDADGGAGTGFTITKGQNVTSCIGNWEAYY